MCFFHVMFNVNKEISSFDKDLKSSIKKDIYTLYNCRDEIEFKIKSAIIKRKWKRDNNTLTFCTYFFKQWINNTFNTWQIFRTKPGYPACNSNLENYNKQIKQHFTYHLRHHNFYQFLSFFSNKTKFIKNFSFFLDFHHFFGFPSIFFYFSSFFFFTFPYFLRIYFFIFGFRNFTLFFLGFP